MRYVCDGTAETTWFRLENEAEAWAESELMGHAVEKHFRREVERARASYKPLSTVFIEQDIGLKDHIARSMPLFLTLRDENGKGLATAMLPPEGRDDRGFRIIIVGPANADPYREHAEAIAALGRHFGLSLDRARCYPYQR
jgi:hypothetical protein